jgi:hypothetical protein
LVRRATPAGEITELRSNAWQFDCGTSPAITCSRLPMVLLGLSPPAVLVVSSAGFD